ncbi:MAG: hypothetical protein WB615_10945, partial [Candidatus Tumulicola sp.]
GEVTALSGDDTFDDTALPLLSRALCTSAALDVAVSSVMLDAGDMVVLLGRRVPGDVDRDALVAHVESAGPAEHVLVARFERDDAADESPGIGERRSRGLAVMPLLLRALVAVVLVLALVLAR